MIEANCSSLHPLSNEQANREGSADGNRRMGRQRARGALRDAFAACQILDRFVGRRSCGRNARLRAGRLKVIV